jgi:hypothetical protein
MTKVKNAEPRISAITKIAQRKVVACPREILDCFFTPALIPLFADKLAFMKNFSQALLGTILIVNFKLFHKTA